MNITITARHMELTEAVKTRVHDAVAKIRHHFDKVIDVDVILTVEKHQRHCAEMNLHANGLRLNAKDESSDLYQSIDNAVAKLDKQVLKEKDRIQRHQPRSAKEAKSLQPQAPTGPIEGGAPTLAEMARPIVREELDMTPLSVEAALEALELSRETFLPFNNADTLHINVIYRRKDGGYGLIEPQF